MTVIARSRESDPTVNLALEEWLFRQHTGRMPLLFIYRNRPAVLIGRNQNPWLECDIDEMSRRGIPLLRRLSGGGAVYHDAGNVNCSVVLPREDYDRNRVVGFLARALHRLGVDVGVDGRFAIWSGGRKVSGNAFMLTGRTALLHGCVLVEADIGCLHACLDAPADLGVTGKAVRSVHAPVANIATLCPGIHSEDVARSFCDIAGRELGPTRVVELALDKAQDDPAFGSYLAKYRSWEWTFGRTPEFTRRVEIRCGAPSFAVQATVRNGLVGALDIVDARADATAHGRAIAALLPSGLRHERTSLLAAAAAGLAASGVAETTRGIVVETLRALARGAGDWGALSEGQTSP